MIPAYKKYGEHLKDTCEIKINLKSEVFTHLKTSLACFVDSQDTTYDDFEMFVKLLDVEQSCITWYNVILYHQNEDPNEL